MGAQIEVSGTELITKAEWDGTEGGSFARTHGLEGDPVELWEASAPPKRA